MPPLGLRIGPIDSPAALNVLRPPSLPARPPGRTQKYSDETIATSERLHAQGVSMADSAAILGLTVEQVKYLRYVRPRQVKGAKPSPVRGRDRTPLHELVPDPITEGHRRTPESNTWQGVRTRYRDDVIRQVKACRGRCHKPVEVGRYFGLTMHEVAYLWYALPDEKNTED